jgi:AraC-like DNA-binding protein
MMAKMKKTVSGWTVILLAQGQLSIVEIVYQLGFEHSSHSPDYLRKTSLKSIAYQLMISYFTQYAGSEFGVLSDSY